MPSVIEGYQYDIFISYRQKDNLSFDSKEGWVTGFVNALKNELEGTFKEPVSIYFDSNPHDGLHEMHDVDGSLKEKVKCLVFVPVLSRTYCDPGSFVGNPKNTYLCHAPFCSNLTPIRYGYSPKQSCQRKEGPPFVIGIGND